MADPAGGGIVEGILIAHIGEIFTANIDITALVHTIIVVRILPRAGRR